MKKIVFGVKEEHLKLLRKMNVDWNDGEFGGNPPSDGSTIVEPFDAGNGVYHFFCIRRSFINSLSKWLGNHPSYRVNAITPNLDDQYVRGGSTTVIIGYIVVVSK